jgi:5-methylthioadenosine/S-adenosylhomocysteine deaminase
VITRLEADHLVPMDASGSVHRPGIVDFEDGRIVWSGPSGAAPVRAHIATTAVSGVLMPGVIDIHCHTPMVLLRGAGEDLPVDRWLRNVMWPREARLTAHDVRAGMTLGAAELLRNGITASVEMYFFGEAIAEAAEAAGLRCVVTPPVIEGSHPARFGSWRDQLADIVTLRHQWAASDLIDVGLGPHAVYSTSEQCLRSVAEIASTHDLLVHIHVDEGRWEDAAVRERTGGFGAIQWLDHLGVLDARVLAAHCVWVTADGWVSPTAHVRTPNTARGSPRWWRWAPPGCGSGSAPTGPPPTTGSTPSRRCGRACGWLGPGHSTRPP